MKKYILLFVIFYVLASCSLFKKKEVIKHPDAPMLILEVDGDRLRIAIYDDIQNVMIEKGWIDANEITSWTVSKYDWEQFIKKQNSE